MSKRIDILITSYNQKDYLAQCLESVLSQRGNFKCHVIVSDDASTDGSRQLIKKYVAKYPDQITAIFQKKNIDRFENKKVLMKAAKTEYIATCDGDDYWCDDQKLQKQLDFLDTHPEFSLCCTKYRQVHEGTGEVLVLPTDEFMRQGATFTKDTFLRQWGYAYSSMMFRRSCFVDFPYQQFIQFEHLHMLYQTLCSGKGRILDFVGSCYRIHQNNAFFILDYWDQVAISQKDYADLLRYFKKDCMLLEQFAITTGKLAQHASDLGDQKLVNKYLQELLITNEHFFTDLLPQSQNDQLLYRKFEQITFKLAKFAFRLGEKELASAFLRQLATLSPDFFLQVPYKGYALCRRYRKLSHLCQPA